MKLRACVVVLIAILALVDLRAVLPASDPFTGTGAIGASWTLIGGTTTASRVSDVLREAIGGEEAIYLWNADAFAANHYAQITLGATVDMNSYMGVGVRMAAGADGYAAVCTSSNCEIVRFDDGAWTTLAVVTMSPMAGNTIKLTAVGTALSVYQNDVFRGSTTDGTYAAGSAGVYLYDGNDTNTTIDDFLGNDVAAGGGAAPGRCLLMGVC